MGMLPGRSLVLLGVALAGTLAGGCNRIRAACDGVEGGCLALHVEGTGSYDRLQGSLLALSGGKAFEMGDAAGAVTLPVVLQILPPTDQSTMVAGAILIEGYRGSVLAASGRSLLNWTNGARVEATVNLMAVPPPDLLPPVMTDMMPMDAAPDM